MTLGQRIQELRKQNNLSQEALGEKLGVSRQAISRWEMDGAVPEVDKLITLSKLFGVPVGWLLGVEEEPAQPGEAPREEPRGLSDTELAAVENVVGRYLEVSGHRERKYKLALAVAAGVELLVVLALTVCLWQIFHRLDRLESRISSAENQISYLDRSIDSQIDSALQRVQAVMEENGSLVENWNYELTGVERGGLCRLDLWVAPKVYEPWTTAQLTLTAGDRTPVTAEGQWDGQVFRFQAQVYAESYVEVRYVQVNDQGVQQTENLTDIGGLDRDTQLSVAVTAPGRRTYNMLGKPGIMTMDYDVEFVVDTHRVDDRLNIKPKSLQLRLVKNGEVIDRQMVELSQALGDPGRYYKEYAWETELQIEEGDEYILNYCLEDTLGQVYQEEIFHFIIEKNKGRLIPVDQPLETQAVMN